MNEEPTKQQRLVIARLMIDMFRTFYQGDDDRFGSNADLILVVCAIAVGSHTGRPMGVTKIANYIGMPRASVVRKIAYLREKGWVEPVGRSKWRLNEEAANMLKPTARALVSLVQQAAKAL